MREEDAQPNLENGRHLRPPSYQIGRREEEIDAPPTVRATAARPTVGRSAGVSHGGVPVGAPTGPRGYQGRNHGQGGSSSFGDRAAGSSTSSRGGNLTWHRPSTSSTGPSGYRQSSSATMRNEPSSSRQGQVTSSSAGGDMSSMLRDLEASGFASPLSPVVSGSAHGKARVNEDGEVWRSPTEQVEAYHPATNYATRPYRRAQESPGYSSHSLLASVAPLVQRETPASNAAFRQAVDAQPTRPTFGISDPPRSLFPLTSLPTPGHVKSFFELPLPSAILGNLSNPQPPRRSSVPETNTSTADPPRVPSPSVAATTLPISNPRAPTSTTFGESHSVSQVSQTSAPTPTAQRSSSTSLFRPQSPEEVKSSISEYERFSSPILASPLKLDRSQKEVLRESSPKPDHGRDGIGKGKGRHVSEAEAVSKDKGKGRARDMDVISIASSADDDEQVGQLDGTGVDVDPVYSETDPSARAGSQAVVDESEEAAGQDGDGDNGRSMSDDDGIVEVVASSSRAVKQPVQHRQLKTGKATSKLGNGAGDGVGTSASAGRRPSKSKSTRGLNPVYAQRQKIPEKYYTQGDLTTRNIETLPGYNLYTIHYSDALLNFVENSADLLEWDQHMFHRLRASECRELTALFKPNGFAFRLLSAEDLSAVYACWSAEEDRQTTPLRLVSVFQSNKQTRKLTFMPCK